MQRVHPKMSFAAACALTALALAGCRSSSTGMAGSPFMSPDRVPPPNTRALLPGQAQPYYQGDPLPTLQSAATPAPASIAALPNDVEARTASGRTLVWAQPNAVTAPPAAPAAVASTQALPPLPQPQSLAAAGEASVAVPNDGDPLRFPTPAPKTLEGSSPIVLAAPTQPTNLAPPVQPQIAASSPSNVIQTSYNAPIPSAPLFGSQPAPSSTQQIASPWRSPQISQAPAAISSQPLAVQPAGTSAMGVPAPPSVPASTMGATLRAVDTPPEPGTPTPRVRMPGYVASEASIDGFRPRTSMQ